MNLQVTVLGKLTDAYMYIPVKKLFFPRPGSIFFCICLEEEIFLLLPLNTLALGIIILYI